jgi:LysR family transcriptional regulator for metE and metH
LAEYADKEIISVRAAGEQGIWPTLYAAVREEQEGSAYLQDFVQLARTHCLNNLRGVRAVALTKSG